ncbi:MFS transporter [Protaetiibacter sp. SSC-01]|uniref:MFS transporter n=1 Tax=Protaetiibacter sp. SSC-01 TaxID=2759943 RepID=UPI0016571732|nr:MFS transporter [Protaetiibacter sp. SSC-01]QNO37364.1 MFS transporter [Protaetiibacter sp. SSC-01]
MAESSGREADGPRRDPVLSRRFVLAVAVNFCVAAIFYLLVTTMALYAIEVFRTDELIAGVVAGAFVVGSIVARLIGGKFLDVIGRRRTLLVCLAACVVLALAQIVAEQLWAVVILQGFMGIAFGAASNAVSAGAFSLIPASRRAEGVGYYGISTTLGAAAGPLLGTLLIAGFGYQALFLATAAWAVVGLVGALLLRLPERDLDDADRAALRSWGLWTFVDRRSFPVASLMIPTGIAFSGVLSFVNPYSVSATGAAVGGSYFALYAVVVFAARLFVGRIQDRFGDNAVVYPLFACLAAGTGVLAFGVDGWIPYVSAVLIAFGFGAMMPTAQSLAVGLAGPQRVALATSTFFLAADIGIGVGPVIDGAIAGWIGYPALYAVLSGVAVLGAVGYTLVHGRASARMHVTST